MTTYDLHPQFDSRKSFYGKARVLVQSNRVDLVSYQTIVATIVDDVATIHDFYSATTTRHIKEFLLQYGFEAENKAQMARDYLREEN